MKSRILLSMIWLLLLTPNVIAQGMTIDSSGNVVIGNANYSAGIVFPDGTVQITAATGGSGGSGGIYFGVGVVAKAGGDYTDPVSAMNDIASWCGTPAVANPCLLQIMPGIYDIGTNNLQMQEYVDIEGSGENVTRIRGSIDGVPGVVSGADNSEIRFITVENTGGGTFAYALSMINAGARVTNVTAIASGANENVGVDCEATNAAIFTNVTAIASSGIAALGFYIDTASPTLINVNSTASDSALNLGIDMNVSSSPIMTNVTAVALRGAKNHGLHINGASSPTISNIRIIASGGTSENYAVYNINASSPVINNMIADVSGVNSHGVYTKNYGAVTGGTVKIDHSVIKGASIAIFTDTTFTALVGNTRIEGSVTGPGSYTCAGVYDENYAFYSGPNCP